MKRTLEGTKAKRQNVSGFRARMATVGGQEVLNRHRAKGRHKIAISVYVIFLSILYECFRLQN